MIIVCGEALIDCLPAVCDGAEGFVPHVGGSPFNVAVGLARLEREVGYLGRLSTDPFGDLLAARLEADGVDLGHVPRTAAPSPLALVHLDDDGVARYSFHLADSATTELALDDLPDPLPERVRAVHTGSLALLLEPGRDAVAALLERASAQGRLTTLDPNVRPTLITDREGYLDDLDGWLALTDVVKVSDEDLAWVHPDADPLEVARAWLGRGPVLAVVTRGAQGAVAVTADGRTVEVEGVPADVVDTIGAGDSFTSGLLAWLDEAGALHRDAVAALDDEDLAAAVRFAAGVAAATCARAGADPPRRAEL
ncbi:MAG: carbohydrate kinase [Egibacteraceae bacterium]